MMPATNFWQDFPVIQVIFLAHLIFQTNSVDPHRATGILVAGCAETHLYSQRLGGRGRTIKYSMLDFAP